MHVLDYKCKANVAGLLNQYRQELYQRKLNN